MSKISKNGLHYYFFIGTFSIAILVLAIGVTHAVPANPVSFYLVQPNGFDFSARQIGDEHAAWIETIDGYTVIRNEDGWWIYAQNTPNVSSEAAPELTLSSTGYRVGDINPHQVSIPKHVRPAYVSSKIDTPLSNLATSVMPTSVAFKSPPLDVPYYSSVTGTRNALVILINFTDNAPDSSHTSSYYDDLIFSQSPTANSMYKYYREVSYNTLNVTGVVGPTWYQSAYDLSYYGADSSSTGIDDENGNIFELAREAVQLADPYIDFSQYDNDGDGVVDHVMIVHAGAGQESSGNKSTDIWSHKWSIYNYYPDSEWESDGEEVDGVHVVGYTMLAEDSPLGTFAHEFGHDLGLPDLYNTATGSTVVGSWCLMDGGSWNNGGNTPSHLSAWCKADLGWIVPTVVDSSQSYLIDQVETSAEAFKVTTEVLESEYEYFLVENREKVGYDSYIPESGILIWHIDNGIINAYRSSNEINAYSIKGVVPELPDGTLYHAAYSTDDGQTVFNTTTTPNSNTNIGYVSNVSIDNIGSEVSSIRVDFFGGEHVPPAFSNETPANTSLINDQAPLISVNVTDMGIGVDISTVTMNVNGIDVNVLSTPITDGYHVENATTQPFADGGIVSVSVSASDHASNAVTYNWSFTVDTSAPILTDGSAYPAIIGLSGTDSTTLSVNATDISGISSVTIDLSVIEGAAGAVMTVNKGTFSIVTNAGGAVAAGTYYLPLNATDNVGNSNTSVNITLEVIDDIPPAIVISSPANGSTGTTSSVNVTGTASDNIGVTGFTVNGNSVDLENGSFNITVSLISGINTITVVAIDAAGNTATETVTVTADIHPLLVFAITPTSRNVQVGTPVTLFMSVINAGTASATGVSISQASGLPATLSYQTWNGTALTGSPDTPVVIGCGEIVHYVLTINATAEFASSPMTFDVSCTNGATAPISGVNTLTMTASATPYADVIMMSTSLDVSTAVDTPTAFAVATTNVGGAEATGVSLIIEVPSTVSGLAYQVDETNHDGSIKGPATGLTIPVGGQPTFAVFLTPTQAIDYDPANNRIMLKLVDGSGKLVGAQSVAISTT